MFVCCVDLAILELQSPQFPWNMFKLCLTTRNMSYNLGTRGTGNHFSGLREMQRVTVSPYFFQSESTSSFWLESCRNSKTTRGYHTEISQKQSPQSQPSFTDVYTSSPLPQLDLPSFLRASPHAPVPYWFTWASDFSLISFGPFVPPIHPTAEVYFVFSNTYSSSVCE